jgi:hypothetical protein
MRVPVDRVLIGYSVEPDVVVCSRPDEPPRTVTLTVHADNASGEPLDCRRISLAIELGDGEPALTLDPEGIRPVPGRTTPWHVGVAGEGQWDCVPLPPATGLGPRQRASFALSRIVVNEVPGDTILTIEEHRGPERREVQLPITKRSAVTTVLSPVPSPCETEPG